MNFKRNDHGKTEKYRRKDHTFVICAYGESAYLEECVRSVLGQTVKSQVCIATSTPNAHIASLAERYNLPVHINTGEKGIASDWNFAVSSAKTPLVTIAHQDDVYCPDYTENILKALNQCVHPLIAFTDYYELRNGETVKKNKLLQVKRMLLFPLRAKIFWKSRFVRRRILSLGSAICCPSVTLVKDHLRLPVFKNNMKSNIDWQAWEEISRSKGEFAYVAKPSMKHRIHQQSTTSAILGECERKKEDLIMYRKFWPGWMAEFIERFYQRAEKSNELK